MARARSTVVTFAFLTSLACSAEPGAASDDAFVPATKEATKPAKAPAADRAVTSVLTLSGRAGPEAIAAVQAEARRMAMTEVEVTTSQSFRILEGGREIATLVTGEGNMPGAVNAGCFVAIRQDEGVKLLPTIGYDNYEAETCGGPVAVGILSSGGDRLRIGAVFTTFSPTEELTNPLVIDWSRSDGTLTIDQALSSRALDAGATSIAAMRRLVR